ncbi:MAG: ATP-binding cassette domain-containing protein, partial [Deltaproteobacteria bacterium]|nr:ATP-binding cassette domain-containing protein [Deltaproteobacteria bacterium]
MIQAVGLHKCFDNAGGPIEILIDAHFHLMDGEAVAVVGESGVGKSTFLHLLGTLDRPDQGTLLFKGKDVCRFDARALAKFRNESVGFVFQFHHLLPEFSTLENTMMPALIRGVRKTEAQEAAEEILVRVGLKERLHHR